MIAQTHCRGISVLLSLKTRLPFDLLAGVGTTSAARPVDEQLPILGDPERRRPVRRRRRPRRLRATGRGVAPRPGRRTSRASGSTEQGLPPNPSVADVARQRGVHPAEAMIDLCVESGGDQLFIQPSLYPQDEAVLLRALRHPRAVMTFSDSGAHLSQIADSSIHTHLLGHWVRDRQEFTLEEAVRMITLAPALAWGFTTGGCSGRAWPPTSTSSTRPPSARPCPAGGRPPRRRPPARAAVGRLPRHGGGRPGHDPRRGAHRGHAGTPAPEPAGLTAGRAGLTRRRYRIQRVRDSGGGSPSARSRRTTSSR